MFNSWDRQPIVHDDDSGKPAIDPKTHQLRGNFIMNKNWIGGTNSGCEDWPSVLASCPSVRLCTTG